MNGLLPVALALAIFSSAAAQTQSNSANNERPPSPQVLTSSRPASLNAASSEQSAVLKNDPRSTPSWGNASIPVGNSNTHETTVNPEANSIYRVGVGDVLDIRIMNLPTRESTLFTVLKDGNIEYPLVGEPIRVQGLREEEIAALLGSRIQVLQTPRINVTVRDYASHAVIVSGLVDNPGRKIMRREAMPLFAMVAEALPRAEADVATITRVNGSKEIVSVSDSRAMSTPIFPGDAVRLSAKPIAATRFLYVGGNVSSPGEKEFREGMTLTQALLAAGGSLQPGTAATIARLNPAGFLTTAQYDLQLIQQGKLQDPVLQPGDRVEVTRRSE